MKLEDRHSWSWKLKEGNDWLNFNDGDDDVNVLCSSAFKEESIKPENNVSVISEKEAHESWVFRRDIDMSCIHNFDTATHSCREITEKSSDCLSFDVLDLPLTSVALDLHSTVTLQWHPFGWITGNYSLSVTVTWCLRDESWKLLPWNRHKNVITKRWHSNLVCLEKSDFISKKESVPWFDDEHVFSKKCDMKLGFLFTSNDRPPPVCGNYYPITWQIYLSFVSIVFSSWNAFLLIPRIECTTFCLLEIIRFFLLSFCHPWSPLSLGHLFPNGMWTHFSGLEIKVRIRVRFSARFIMKVSLLESLYHNESLFNFVVETHLVLIIVHVSSLVVTM